MILYLQYIQLKEKERHNEKHGIQKELAINSIMLLHNSQCKKNISQKLAFKWIRPYTIYNAVEGKKTYMLEELDRSHLAGIFTGDRFKKFHA